MSGNAWKLGAGPVFKVPRQQVEDLRCIDFWGNVLGPETDVRRIGHTVMAKACANRMSGAIDSHGRHVPEGERRPVGARTVESDVKWLNAVMNWATKHVTAEGEYLIEANPIRGFKPPRELNPRRPIRTQDEYEAILAVSDQVTMYEQWGLRRQRIRSYLTEALAIVNGTGRRISAVRCLTYADLLLDEGPYGSIRWRKEHDKSGRETIVPISPEVRAAIDRIIAERPGIGAACLFPAPRDPNKPVRYELLSEWLHKAERLAGIEPLEGSCWHAYRRKWATERKHLPGPDVAAAGGWANARTLETIYQQADPETMLKVVLEGGKLRRAY